MNKKIRKKSKTVVTNENLNQNLNENSSQNSNKITNGNRKWGRFSFPSL